MIKKKPFTNRFAPTAGMFLLFMLSFSSLNLFAQKAAAFTVSTAVSVTNITCYGGSMTASYVTTAPAPSGYTYPTNYIFNLAATSFELRDASGAVVTTNNGGTVGGTSTNPTISGSFTISTPGVYTIYASIAITDITNAVSVIKNSTNIITVGYETVWADLVDMEAQATSYSCRRLSTVSSAAYGEAQSSNYLSASVNGWMEMTAQFGAASTSRSVYALLSDYSQTAAFNPAVNGNYVEFRKGGTITTISGEGVYVKNGANVYKLQGVVLTDRIRIERVAGAVKFYKQNSLTALNGINVSTSVTTAPLSLSLTNEFYVLGYGPLAGDGLANVYTSFPCNESAASFAKLEKNLTGVNYKATTRLFFYYEEEYNAIGATAPLDYKILNSQRQISQSTSTVAATSIYGDNRYELNVSSLASGTYILEVTNDKKEVFYLRFTK